MRLHPVPTPLRDLLTEAGIPVLGHVGMTPQSVNEYGGFKRQGVTRAASQRTSHRP